MEPVGRLAAPAGNRGNDATPRRAGGQSACCSRRRNLRGSLAWRVPRADWSRLRRESSANPSNHLSREMSDGIRSLSAEDYFRASGVSRSMLETLVLETPKHFHAKFIARTAPDKETPAKRMGSLVHRRILEPDTMTNA